MINLIAIIFLLISAVIWGICIKFWTTDSKSNHLIAYLLKFPAILFTGITLILLIVSAFIK